MKLSVEFQDGKYDPQVIKNVILAVAPEAHVIQATEAEVLLAKTKAPTKADLVLGENAEAIAQAIEDAPKSATWTGKYLVNLLYGGDTWQMSGGHTLLSPRPEAIACSRFLKKSLPTLFPSHCKPPELLAEHARIYFKEGGYKGIEYRPTKLGRLVADILATKDFFKNSATQSLHKQTN